MMSESTVLLFGFEFRLNRPLKNVLEAAGTRQKQARKRSLCIINERFKPVFNIVAATRMVFQRPVNGIKEIFKAVSKEFI
jgi:hypothetical protein